MAYKNEDVTLTNASFFVSCRH